MLGRLGRSMSDAAVLVLVVVIGLVMGTLPAHATTTTSGGRFLLVADPIARAVYVYDVPGLTLTGRLDDLGLGVPGTGANAGLGSPIHSGTVVLPEGRILAIDDVAQEIIEIQIDDHGEPRIVNRVAAVAPGNGAWSVVDPAHRYFAVSSSTEDETTGLVNLIDLDTFENTVLEFPLTVAEEVHPYLAGDPVTLAVSVGGRMQTYPVADLLGGERTPTSDVAVGLGGHGQFVSSATSTWGVTTAGGLEVVDVVCTAGTCAEPTAGSRTLVPWDVDGLAGSQNFRPRLANDGASVLGVLGVAPEDPALWADTRQDVHVVDLKGRTAVRFTIGQGLAPRFAISDSVAVLATVHPDGDLVHLLDVRTDSATYAEIVGEVKLTPMLNGPVAGEPTAGRERRFLAVTPDGHHAFASHGGAGMVSMIDTDDLSVTEFAVPSPLSGGGYLVGIDLDFDTVDLVGR